MTMTNDFTNSHRQCAKITKILYFVFKYIANKKYNIIYIYIYLDIYKNIYIYIYINNNNNYIYKQL